MGTFWLSGRMRSWICTTTVSDVSMNALNPVIRAQILLLRLKSAGVNKGVEILRLYQIHLLEEKKMRDPIDE